MLKVFILNGVAESGKNFFVDQLRSLLNNKVEHYSTISPVNDFLENMGINVTYKTEELRILQSSIKNCLEQYDNMIINKKIIMKCLEPEAFIDGHVYFIDCREPHNIEKIKEKFEDLGINCKTILIYRPEVIGKFKNEKDSIDNVMKIKYDYVIENNSLLDFNKKIVEFAKEIKK